MRSFNKFSGSGRPKLRKNYMFRLTEGFPLIISETGTRSECGDNFRDIFDVSDEAFELVRRTAKKVGGVTAVRSDYNTLLVFRPNDIPVLFASEVRYETCPFYTFARVLNICDAVDFDSDNSVEESDGLSDEYSDAAASMINDVYRLTDALNGKAGDDPQKLPYLVREISAYFRADINTVGEAWQGNVVTDHYSFNTELFSLALTFAMIAFRSGIMNLKFGYTEKLLYADMEFAAKHDTDDSIDQFLSLFDTFGAPIMCVIDGGNVHMRVCPYVRTRLFDGALKNDLDFIDFGEIRNEYKES